MATFRLVSGSLAGELSAKVQQLSMISKSTLDLLTLAANWFAAIGTNAAVMVALWLAYRQTGDACV